ncbi:hypothetical protein HYW46_06460 [Candidatus Daviesbacteria bacterium]|nr:hypothetical protein [Candidatus Daviesbacteria bacterium]
MPNNERGFIPPVVLILIGVLVVAAIGYLFTNRKSQSSQTPANITTNTKTETKAEVTKPSQDFPSPVNSILDKIDMEKVEAAGMTIYRGDKPPNIEGTYRFNSLVVTYDSANQVLGREVNVDQYQYYGQRDGAVKIIYNDDKTYDGIVWPKGYISGKGQCFTIFLQTKNEPKECETLEIELTSACKVDQGLGQVKRAGMLKQKGTACGDLIPVDSLRVVSETDGLAEQKEEF